MIRYIKNLLLRRRLRNFDARDMKDNSYNGLIIYVKVVSCYDGDTFRVVYFYPDQIVVQIGADRTIIDGFFIGAAAAGFLSGIPNDCPDDVDDLCFCCSSLYVL